MVKNTITKERMLEIAEGYCRCAIQTSGDGDCGKICIGRFCPNDRNNWDNAEKLQFWKNIIELLSSSTEEGMKKIAQCYYKCTISTINDNTCGIICANGHFCQYSQDNWSDEEEVEFWEKIIDIIST